MGCSASSHQQRAEAEFFAEQRRNREQLLQTASTKARTAPNAGPAPDLGRPISESLKTSGSEPEPPRPGPAPPASGPGGGPSPSEQQEAASLPGTAEEGQESPSPRKKSIAGVAAGALSVGAVFRAALEDQCSVALTAETLPTIVEMVLKALDKDSNGVIELYDLRKFIQTVCREAGMEVPPDEQVSEVFHQLDIDRSGAISRAELAAVMFRWFIVGVC
ncbi:hypothetical protein HYH03_004422 [Edaphochlamys debaryana]|uniref:EF-hand domain-containing protein n=1 Tax=Edaphochlamys debaryana TaxID=47281 RepID=A0A835Y7H3_9CHLO|nr:hypothetical protein HYH03_004422 [Edaphochlamys debaryana]|eukprot:KAG2497685.1 hypothetical protein HYH03_004422 [Edaphochlamys debaryana]